MSLGVKKGKNGEDFCSELIFMQFFYYICRLESRNVQRAVYMGTAQPKTVISNIILPAFHFIITLYKLIVWQYI